MKVGQGFNDETVVTRIGKLEGFNKKEPALDFIAGPAMGQQILLTEGESVWGRSKDADLMVEDEAISRYHFKIKVKDKVVTIEDLNSTNGTYVNGIRIKQHVLQPNDKIQISSLTVLRFSYVDPIDTDVHNRIYEMALFDPITRAHTKRYFLDRLRHEFSHYKRRNQPLALMIFDLDFFKKVNDNYGHPAGDYILEKVAEITMTICRKGDIFARYGGEEFVIIMRDTSEQEATAMAERLRSKIENGVFEFEENKIPITVSVGVACFDKGNFENSDDLIKAADQCLYYSKAHGRNIVTALSTLH